MTADQEYINAAWKRYKRTLDMDELENYFKIAIRDAIKAERERCAKIAEGFIPSGFPGHYGTARDDRARTIAAAIRGQIDTQ
jgi:hypothetical protein